MSLNFSWLYGAYFAFALSAKLIPSQVPLSALSPVPVAPVMLPGLSQGSQNKTSAANTARSPLHRATAFIKTLAVWCGVVDLRLGSGADIHIILGRSLRVSA